MNEKYDILFLDINLTVISGIEILKKIKNPPYVIITTAYPYAALHDLNIAEMDYLFKPFSEDMFNIMKGNKHQEVEYQKRLKKLTAKRWKKGKW